MGKIAPHNRHVATVITADACDRIDARRTAQTMTRSKYVSLIVAKWVADGCPPVNAADRPAKATR